MHRMSPRRKRFRAALDLAGHTQESWATTVGVTAGHLSQVLGGKRESAALTEKIDAFILEHLPEPQGSAA